MFSRRRRFTFTFTDYQCLSEIYLNRAEAYAKLGNYSAALANLNTIRERSIIGGGYASLDATNASERIDKERQLELAYQAERSYDVFRNGKPLTRRYPGPHQQFEDIPASDYRVIFTFLECNKCLSGHSD